MNAVEVLALVSPFGLGAAVAYMCARLWDLDGAPAPAAEVIP